jgi:hypothetical protein
LQERPKLLLLLLLLRAYWFGSRNGTVLRTIIYLPGTTLSTIMVISAFFGGVSCNILVIAED